MTKEARMTKSESNQVNSSFGFRHSFVICASSFVITRARRAMRKKISLRVLAFLVAVVVAAALVNPSSRQWIFGPTYQGVPLCAWQDQIRRQTLGEDERRWLTKLRKWLEPKADGSLTEKLTREDRIAIWLSLLDDPVPAMRARSVQTLWEIGRASCRGRG